MLPMKRNRTLRWAGRLGCLVLAGTLVAPPVALARDYQERGQDSQVTPQKPHESKGGHNNGQVIPQTPQKSNQGHKPQAAPQKPQKNVRGHNPQVAQHKPPQNNWGGHSPQVVPRMPPGHHTYNYHGTNYYYHGGMYYRPYGRGYVVVRPPRGFFLQILPIGFATMMLAGLTYYTFAGIYYRPAPGGYVVVDPPAGVVVTSPPAPPMVAPSAPLGTAVVIAPSLNVRTGPGRDFPVTTTVPQGYNLTVYGQSPGWLYVQTPSGEFGWVAQRFTNMPVVPTPSG